MDIINGLGDYNVPIIESYDSSINKMNVIDTDYIGKCQTLPLNFIGQAKGIDIIYNKLMDNYETT